VRDGNENGRTISRSNSVQAYDYKAIIIEIFPKELVPLSNYSYAENNGVLTINTVSHLGKRLEKVTFQYNICVKVGASIFKNIIFLPSPYISLFMIMNQT